MRSRFALPALVGTLIACSSDVLGPAAGYANIFGVVTKSNGELANNVQVLLSGCSSPALGGGGSTFTDRIGRYSVAATLPPVGAGGPLPRDSVIGQCTLLAARDTSSVVQLDVWFWANAGDVTPIEIDLTIR